MGEACLEDSKRSLAQEKPTLEPIKAEGEQWTERSWPSMANKRPEQGWPVGWAPRGRRHRATGGNYSQGLLQGLVSYVQTQLDAAWGPVTAAC